MRAPTSAGTAAVRPAAAVLDPRPNDPMAVPAASPIAESVPDSIGRPPASGTNPSVKPLPLPAAAQPSKHAGRLLPIAGGVMLVLVAMGYFASRPSEKDVVCAQQLASATQQQAAGDASGARSLSLLALVSCSGLDRTRAVELQATADRMIASQANCERGYRRSASQLSEHRLQSARSALDGLDTSCGDSAQGRTVRLQIDAAQSEAASTEATLRQKLAEGDLKAARSALDQLSSQNREHLDLVTLRQNIQAAAKAQELSASAASAVMRPSDPTAPTVVPAPEALSPRALSPSPVPSPDPQPEMARAFLRDAETAMQQLQFDKAKTLVESAQRIDPSSAQAVALARRVKERELEYARKEMIIK